MADTLKPDNRELTSTIHEFEAAVTARHVDLVPPPLDVILVAIDGSNQSDMALGLAQELARRMSAIVHVACVYNGPSDPGADAALRDYVGRLEAAGVKVAPAPRQHADQPLYLQITDLARLVRADLLVVPAPYMEDFAELGSDSIGVTLDKLMTHALPLLVVREPRAVPADSLKPLLLALSVHVQENPLAAAWALRIIGDSGTIHIVAVVDDRVVEAAAGLIGEHDAADLDLDHLAGLDQPDMAGLIAAVQRTTQQRGVGCRVSVQQGDLVRRVIDLAEGEQRLIVTGCDTDPGSHSYRTVQALIRRATDPVLVI